MDNSCQIFPVPSPDTTPSSSTDLHSSLSLPTSSPTQLYPFFFPFPSFHISYTITQRLNFISNDQKQCYIQNIFTIKLLLIFWINTKRKGEIIALILYLINMSYIIQQLERITFSPHLSSPYTHKSHSLQQSPIHHLIQAQTQTILKSLGKMTCMPLEFSVGRCCMSLQVLLNQVFRNLPVILKIGIDPQGEAFFSLRLLTPRGEPLMISSRARRLLLCRVMANRYRSQFQQFKITVGMSSGEVKLQSCAYLLGNTVNLALERLLPKLLRNLSQNLGILYQPINFTTQISNQSCRYFQQELGRRQKQERVKKIYYYSTFSNVFINLATESTTEELTMIQMQQREMQAINTIKHNFANVNTRNGMDLYLVSNHNKLVAEVSNFDITLLQREDIKAIITPPPILRGQQFEIPYVLSHIQLCKRMDNTPMAKKAEGGFSIIYLAEIQYMFVGSYGQPGQPGEVMKGYPVQKRKIIIKRDSPALLARGKNGKVAHQKEILKKIKNGVSLFLPRYYIVSEQTSPFFNDLLMDYIGAPMLVEWVARTKQTMSFKTKLMYALAIARGLSYLQGYDIAHLDIKPTNIMLCKKTLIKLIDFGQAYHPDIKDHKPGFSAPYSAPENYNSPSRYCHKNDVFSFGVILHELLFDRVPFRLYDDKLRDDVYRNSNLNKYWFCVPEQNMNYGESTVLPMIHLMIGKCLSSSQRQRPELEWIVLILITCLEIIS